MKVRLNKKTKEELSAGQALSTLKTKQTRVEEDITTYIDEPFFKPENIRHGINMAGVEGKYADVKYLNIWEFNGSTVDYLGTLASTERYPEVGHDGDPANMTFGNTIYLTNKPFENQYAYNIGHGDYLYTIESGDINILHSSTAFRGQKMDLVIDRTNCATTEQLSEVYSSVIVQYNQYKPYYFEISNLNITFDEETGIGETSRMLIKQNVSESDYTDVCDAFGALECISNNTILGDSKVSIYETFSQRIVVQYLNYSYSDKPAKNHGELRIIEDSRTGEFNKLAFSNTGYSNKTSEYDGGDTSQEGTFIMLYDNEGYPNKATDGTKRYPGGMGFIFKLSDGSFFVIDGGMGGNNEYYSQWKSQAETLLNALRAYAPDPNHIRIAGWLLTHLHQDHVGVFDEVVYNHLDTVSIDKVIYSLPAEGFSGFDKPAAYSIWDDFEEALNTLRVAGKTEIIKAHMGMKFNFGNLGLTILSAPENVYGSSDPVAMDDPTIDSTIWDIGNINDSCVVCTVNYYGKDLLFLADAYKVQLRAVIVPLLTNYIIDNIEAIQVPHHGYTDTNAGILYNQLENSSNIEFTLWPVCYEHFWGKNLDGSAYQETSGVNYSGIYEHSHNAAIKNITAIYPNNNISMVATPRSAVEWTFEAVDFVDPCPHSSGTGQSKAFANNDGTHTWKEYCNDCQSWAIYQYTTECSYDADGYCSDCGAMNTTTCSYCSNLASPSDTCCACGEIICSSHVSSYEGGLMCKACYGEA